MNLKKALFSTGLAVGISMLALMRFPDALKAYQYILLVRAPSMESAEVAGEFVKGFRLEQEFEIADASEKEMETGRGGSLCVAMFLATYKDRPNKGRFKATVADGRFAASEMVDFKDVEDNSFKTVCFDQTSDENLHAGSYKLVLEGIEGAPGKCITAWLTSDVEFGAAVINGVVGKKGLRLAVMQRKEDQTRRIIPFILALLCTISIWVLSYEAFERTPRRKLKSGWDRKNKRDANLSRQR